MSAIISSSAGQGFALEEAQASRAQLEKFSRAHENPRKTAQEFEAFFLTQMFEVMSAGVKTDGPMGGGQAESKWRSFLNDQYGREMSKGRGIGIADMVYDQMIKMQEAQP